MPLPTGAGLHGKLIIKNDIEMNKKGNILKFALGLAFMAFPSRVFPQGMTYNHDSYFMNQFLVTETGSGSLSPSFYYDVFHKSYQGWAYMGNKNSFRTSTALGASKEVSKAENVDSTLTYRAKIEELNMIECLPNMSDAAWLVEKKKINTKLDMMKRNIELITMRGGSVRDHQQWVDSYNAIEKGLKAVRDAYMPLSQRKRAYLEVYQDLVRMNNDLSRYLYQLTAVRNGSRLNNIQMPNKPQMGLIVNRSFQSWYAVTALGM